MQYHNLPICPDFNFGTDNVFIQKNSDEGMPFPPVIGFLQLLNGEPFFLLNDTNFLLL